MGLHRTRDDDDEFHYRFTLWKLDGFKTRQNFTVFKDESKAKLDDEKSVVIELYKDLYSNPIYKELSEKKQKQFEKKSFKWHPDLTSIASMAGINERYWRNTYAFMSHYVHSGYISAFQIRQIDSIEKAKSQCLSSLQLVLILLARFINEYSTFHQNIDKALKSNTNLLNSVNLWVDLSEGLQEFYDEKG